MEEAVIDDLKQFIATTVSQATADMATKADLAKLENKVDGIGEKLDVVMEAVGERLDDHEQRLTKLETKTA